MVYWVTNFRLPTKDASRFLMAAKRLIKEKCGFEWEAYTDVGERITKIHLYAPTFGYRVDLQTPWEVIRNAEQEFHRRIAETKKGLLELAERYKATVEVYNGGRNSKFVQPRKILEAEAAEEKAVNILAEALKEAKQYVEKNSEILSLDSIYEKAKRKLSPFSLYC